VVGSGALKPLLKMLFASGSLAGAVALVLGIQNFTQYSSLVQVVQSNLSTSSSPYVPQTRLYGIAVDGARGEATMTFTPFTSPNVAAAFGAQYGMKMLSSLPAFGQFDFALPQIQIAAGPQPQTVTVDSPPSPPTGDISAYLSTPEPPVLNLVSTVAPTGRLVVSCLPK